MTKLFIIILLVGISTKVVSQNNASLTTWNKYQEDFPSDKNFRGFSLTFLYPKTIELLDVVDNCRCVGNRIKSVNDDDPAWNKNNFPFWCICLTDTNFLIEDEIIAYKSSQKINLIEKRDSVVISGTRSLRITLMRSENDFLIQFIYLKKYGTLFEISNRKELNGNFDFFLNNINIKG